MSRGRTVGTIAAAFLVSQVLAILVHGFVLDADYEPFYGTLLRPMPTEGDWRMLLLPLTHLCYVSALVWVYARARINASRLVRGLVLGSVGYAMAQAPMWMLWYAEQPWPGLLVVKQLGLELVSSLIIGATIALVARRHDEA